MLMESIIYLIIYSYVHIFRSLGSQSRPSWLNNVTFLEGDLSDALTWTMRARHGIPDLDKYIKPRHQNTANFVPLAALPLLVLLFRFHHQVVPLDAHRVMAEVRGVVSPKEQILHVLSAVKHQPAWSGEKGRKIRAVLGAEAWSFG